jgi:hypothetical protein
MSMLGIVTGIIIACFGVSAIRDGAERSYSPATMIGAILIVFGLWFASLAAGWV